MEEGSKMVALVVPPAGAVDFKIIVVLSSALGSCDPGWARHFVYS